MRDYSQKENLILTTGRIGEEIKNHEMILRALARIEMKDWKMAFVGPVNPHFQKVYEKFLKENPQFKDRIVFTGNISDREELYEWYNRSKILCMTSRNESFCHSIVEGLYFGNYILGTEGIMSMKDISDNGKYGQVMQDDNDGQLAAALQKLIDDEHQLRELYPQIVNFSRNHFVWSRIIHKIADRLS
jgi:glycosyltransferase involved in cell wall biosynthesis